jgi:two-component system, OmpR family, KDP operon response regulator KdpE
MSEHAPVVVVIEDERQIRRFLRSTLEAEGYQVFEAETGKAGLTEAGTRKPDLAIVDLGLPDMDGVEVVAQLRGWSSIPILILSARTGEADKVQALDKGADDYLTKPFGTAELLARLRAALRRRSQDPGTARPGDAFTVAGLRVDLAARAVSLDGQVVHLTPIEYRLLAELVRHAGKVLTHRHLLREVWGPSHVEHSHYLHIYMGQLRHKLEREPARPRFLLTEVGVGYRLATE